MVSKSSSPGPNATTTTPAKQARSRKAATTNAADVGRAGSAGGIVLEKEKEKVAKTKSTPGPKSTPTQDATPEATSAPAKTARRKPRKLNKEPTSAPAPAQTTSSTAPAPTEHPTPTELEALKSRVRGLESKVEELYKTGALDRPGRSPRRRGKGRKGSSQQQVPTLASTAKARVEDDEDVEEIGRGSGNAVEGEEEEEEGVEELVRLEGELEVARQDLAAFRPRNKRTASNQTNLDGDDVEDIPRDSPGVEGGTSGKSNRHVTLSGSYRIPLPASVSVDDVKNIQSGVSAAQNVARSFLEQRRAAATLRDTQQPKANGAAPKATKTAKPNPRPTPKSVSSSMEIAEIGQGEGGKQSWSEWIGGYSVAISRAVKNIEHEAAVESQQAGPAGGSGTGAKKASTGTKKGAGTGKSAGASKSAGKRPGVKTKLSGEQVDGLMS